MPLHKAWTFCCSSPSISALASTCPRPWGFHPRVSGKRLSDGTFRTRLSACYPSSLADAVAALAAPFLTASPSPDPVRLSSWPSLLPSRLLWPSLPHRVEDGAGTCSTARPLPVSPDPLAGLRASWSKRLLDSWSCVIHRGQA